MDSDDPRGDRDPSDDDVRMVRWRPPGWSRGRAVPIAAGVGGGLLLAQAVGAIFMQVRGILVILIVSLFLSFALEPAVQWLAQRGVRRGIGTWMVFLLVFAAFASFVWAMAGLVIDQVRTLIEAGPSLLADLASQAERLPGELGDQVAQWLDEQQLAMPAIATDAAGVVGRGVLGIGQTLVGGLFQVATIGLVTFYLVADGPRLRFRLASRLAPAQQVRVLGVWELAISKTGGYVYSRALTAIASAIFHVAVFAMIGLDYAVALGIWVGLISSLIPAVGTYLAGALPLIVALATAPLQALWVLIAVVAYQQVENYYVVPRITASTLRLHPAVAFLSVITGGVLAGATGALLAIPAVAIGTALLAAAAEEFDVLEHQLVATGPIAARELVEELEAEREQALRAFGRGNETTTDDGSGREPRDTEAGSDATRGDTAASDDTAGGGAADPAEAHDDERDDPPSDEPSR